MNSGARHIRRSPDRAMSAAKKHRLPVDKAVTTLLRPLPCTSIGKHLQPLAAGCGARMPIPYGTVGDFRAALPQIPEPFESGGGRVMPCQHESHRFVANLIVGQTTFAVLVNLCKQHGKQIAMITIFRGVLARCSRQTHRGPPWPRVCAGKVSLATSWASETGPAFHRRRLRTGF